ncbi:uncharacterized protein N7482_004739 [Penicillium canariense]|uniref:Thioredoxin-like protein n=1 Tax=Penicillium canariense TaxID=189055 RepID=A0A9W9I9Q6_9EURO|nr:uncharacterized protein N7482_004739 [Penicillium canariense]KAJ5169145.1 hypothetical protein N7482_004739 [Penicillium canariense]
MPADSDDEALFAALENEEAPSYRDTRIQQLNAEFASAKTNRSTNTANPSGASATLAHNESYPTLTSDQAVLDHTTSSSRTIVHFAHADFGRCEVMDRALVQLAGLHYEVRFARVDVRNTPFLVEKLGIRVLPCVIGFKDGLGVERVVGFEGLGERGFDPVPEPNGGGGVFSVGVLERRMVAKGVFVAVKAGGGDGSDNESDHDSDRGRRRGGRKLKSKTIRGAKVQMDEDDDDDWE